MASRWVEIVSALNADKRRAWPFLLGLWITIEFQRKRRDNVESIVLLYQRQTWAN